MKTCYRLVHPLKVSGCFKMVFQYFYVVGELDQPNQFTNTGSDTNSPLDGSVFQFLHCASRRVYPLQMRLVLFIAFVLFMFIYSYFSLQYNNCITECDRCRFLALASFLPHRTEL